jgi:tetratricopeptide (TPR) repeat protein
MMPNSLSLTWRLMGVVLLATGCTTQDLILQGPISASRLAQGSASSHPLDLKEIPYFPQKAFQCGPAALATVLVASGVETTPSELTPKIYLPERRGSLQLELLAATRRYGRLPYLIDGRLSGLLAQLRAGHPVLVLQNLGWKLYPLWHYAVVVGADPVDDRILLRSGTTRRKAMPASQFLKTWERAGWWGLVVLHPGELPALPIEETYIRAAASLEAAGQHQAALTAYSTALKRWPNNTLAMLGLGNTHYAQGRLPEAEAAYRHLLALHPDDLAARNNLAQVLADRGCTEAALRELGAAPTAEEVETTIGTALSETRATILKRPLHRRASDSAC